MGFILLALLMIFSFSFQSPGPDSIVLCILKSCATQLAPSMTYMLKKSFITGQLPEDWKHAADITPLHKKGPKFLRENYPPSRAPCLLARGTLLGGLSFWHVNGTCRVTRLTEVRGPSYIPRKLLMLTAFGDCAQLVECKIIALDTEKLAERVIEKNKLATKTFHPPFCLLFSTPVQNIANRLSRAGELHVKAVYVSTFLAGFPG